MSTCPNCNTPIKSKGLLSSGNSLIQSPDKRFELISFLWESNPTSAPEALCNECVGKMLNKASFALTEEMEEIDKNLIRLSGIVPTLSVALPDRWQYRALGIVTSQVVSGTGIFSELSAGWNDFWGSNSNTLAAKISSAEASCLAQLRAKALRMGGNAIIGIDLDYAEVGSLRGMLMVCATGTTVRLENIELLGTEWEVKFRDLENKMNRRMHLAALKARYEASN